MSFEQSVKEFALVAFVTGLMAAIGVILFLNHDALYGTPERYVAGGYCWFLLMYLLYIRRLAQWVVTKEMGVDWDEGVT